MTATLKLIQTRGLNDYYSSEEDNEDELFQHIDVGNGIKVKTSEELMEPLGQYKTTVWSNEERNKHFKPPPHNQKNVKFVTDIYKFSTTAVTKAVKNITNADEKKLVKEKQCTFALVDKYHGKVYFQVPVDENIVPIKDKDINTYWAWVEMGDTWRAIPASLMVIFL